jgi:hypothetical protein
MNGKICFCFCFVESFAEMKTDLDKPKDFVRAKLASTEKAIKPFWKGYRQQIVEPFKRLRWRLERWPAICFRRAVKVSDFLDILRSGEYETVILYSHCKDGGKENEAVEFYDKLITSRQLAESIPARLNMDLDFSVCKPILLRKELEAIPGRQFVIINWEKEINLKEWLWLYELILWNVRRNPDQSYSHAFTAVLGRLQ